MKKILPVILIASVLAFIGLSFFIPTLADSALQKRKELRLLQNEEKIIPQTAALIESKRDEISLLDAAFPTKKDLILVAQTLDSLAAAAGVAVELHFESEEVVTDRNGDTVMPVEITIEGEYANVAGFLEALKNGKYLYDFLAIEGDSEKGIKSVNKVSVRANLYASE